MAATVAFLLLSPLAANSSPTVLTTDMLRTGEMQLRASYAVDGAEWKSQYQNPSKGIATNSAGSLDASTLTAAIALGVSDALYVSATLPDLMRWNNQEHETAATLNREYVRQKSGLEDISISAKYLLFDHAGRTVLTGFVRLPSASDTPYQTQVVDNGTVVLQKGIAGSAGTGRTDVGIGLAWSGARGRLTPTLDAAYTHVGSKTQDGVDYNYGEAFSLRGGALFALNSSLDIGAELIGRYNAASTIGNQSSAPMQSIYIEPAIIAKVTHDFYVSAFLNYGRVINEQWTINGSGGVATRKTPYDAALSGALSLALTW